MRKIVAAAAIVGFAVAAAGVQAAPAKKSDRKAAKFANRAPNGGEPYCVASNIKIGDPPNSNEVTVAISTTGNIFALTHAGAFTSIYIANSNYEGYVLTDSVGTVYYDAVGAPAAGFDDSGNWNVATQVGCTDPNKPLPLTISRTTSDGKFKLDMKYALDKSNHMVTITHTITNTSAVTAVGVRFARVFDADMNHTFTNDTWDKTIDAVTGSENEGLGAYVTKNTKLFAHSTAVQSWSDLNSDLYYGTLNIDPTTPATTPVVGDFGGRVIYEVGDILAGKKAVVVTQYRTY